MRGRGMSDYELRLTDSRGQTSLVYRFLTMDDVQAIKALALVPGESYMRYELWRGMDLIEEGPGRTKH
jgi:hypothetical protein